MYLMVSTRFVQISLFSAKDIDNIFHKNLTISIYKCHLSQVCITLQLQISRKKVGTSVGAGKLAVSGLKTCKAAFPWSLGNLREVWFQVLCDIGLRDWKNNDTLSPPRASSWVFSRRLISISEGTAPISPFPKAELMAEMGAKTHSDGVLSADQ